MTGKNRDFGLIMKRLVVALLLFPSGALSAIPAGAQEPLRLSGQVGFRTEYMANENFAVNDATRKDDHRVRLRARVRFGASYAPSDRVSLGFRISTGSSTYPSSGWSSLSDDFRRDQISFDRVYMRYQMTKGISLRFGYDANALFSPTELVWDGDVSPGGLTQVWSSSDGLELVTGQYMLREVRSSKPVRSAQSFLLANGLSYRWNGGADYRVGIFNYSYTEPHTIATAIEKGELDGDYKTNRFRSGDAGAYFSDYHIVGAGFTLGGGDWNLATEAAMNLGANADASLGEAYAEKENLAFTALVTFGSLGEPGSWNVTTGYARIEADAVMAPYNSDDLQQTNVSTVPVWIRVQLPGGARLVWDTYFQSKLNEALASNGGFIHSENAGKVRTRLTIQANF